MNIGATVLVFGLLMLIRGLLDVFRCQAVAVANRGLNARRRSSNTGAMPNQPLHAEDPAEVRRQGKNVLWFSAVTIAVGVVLMVASSVS